MGAGAQGKEADTGAKTKLEEEMVRKEQVLSSCDQSQHGRERGLDGRGVPVNEYRDTAADRRAGHDE